MAAKTKKKNHSPAVSRDVWEQIRTLYIFGVTDPETGITEYPSHRTLGKQFGIQLSTIAYHSTTNGWKDIRDRIEKRELVETRKQLEESVIMSRAELNQQDIIIHDAVVGQFAEQLASGDQKVSTSEGLKASFQRRQIYNEIHGVEQDRQLVDLKVEIDIDIKRMDNRDLQRVFDQIAIDQIRQNSVEADFTEDASDTEELS